jgi:hypothetical protein
MPGEECRVTVEDQQFDEEFIRLSLAINEHLPGYVDSYFGPDTWAQEAKQAGKLPLADLASRVTHLANDIARADDVDPQRKDFLKRQVHAMEMSLRLLEGEHVSLAEEVYALYDIQPSWEDESTFREAHRELDELLPGADPLHERLDAWRRSLEIPIDRVNELLPYITDRLRELTRRKFRLPEQESFDLDFVSNEPWSAYNWYLGDYRSRIAINTDLPLRVNALADLIAHEGYPGHHTELSIKEARLIRRLNYREFLVNLINSPSCVIAEGIATSALESLLSEEELEVWYREEILPRAGMSHMDAATILGLRRSADKLKSLSGNAAFMLHDQKKSADEIRAYLQEYGLLTEKEANQRLKFISNPLYRSYTFTYHVGYDLLQELFRRGDRDRYFARLLEEPVTPSQVRQWIKASPGIIL